MPVNHLVVLKLAKVCDAVMRPDVAKVWPEQHEKDFHLTAAGKVRHNGDDAKPKKFINTVVRNEMPSIFLAVGETDAGGNVKGRNNPWSAAGWSVTRQGDVTKSLGVAKAAQIAAAAGSFVGATKPGTTKRLTQTYEKGPDGGPRRIT